MNTTRIIFAAARADFLERVRRYSFLFTLGFALYFGYLATVGRLTLRVGDSRGVYDSAWIGGLLAIVGSIFVSLAGFYFVKNTIQRDRETRVGQILAATPISKFAYMFAKFSSNFAVLSAMMGILALSGIAMQLVRGEDTHIHLWKLASPFLLLSIPAMAVIAALAVVFETIPFLRGGFGNVIYFFVWTAILSAPVATKSLVLDLSGLSLLRQNLASHAAPAAAESFSISLDLGQFKPAAALFRWEGIPWTADIVLPRLALFVVAVLLCVFAALLFDRFDTSRSFRRLSESQPTSSNILPGAGFAASAAPILALTPISASIQQFRFLPVLIAEVRLMLKGQKWWWYTMAVGLLVASGVVPDASARGIILACAWIWPILLWSSMGIREVRFQTNQLLFSAPHPIARQLPAVWLAGVILAMITGGGFALLLLMEGNLRGMMAWMIGAMFIPTAALACGVWSGSGKLFEILYTLIWYLGPMHAFPALDYAGSAPGTAATHYPFLYFGIAAVFALAAVAGRKRQLLV